MSHLENVESWNAIYQECLRQLKDSKGALDGMQE